MRKIYLFLAAFMSFALLSSCDTTALEQALSQPSSYDSGYGRPPAYDRHDGYYHPNHPPHNRPQENQAQLNRDAYRTGHRLGADDFRRGREKKYMRHSDMYDARTREKFKDGFYAGYEEARDDYKRRNKKRR